MQQGRRLKLRHTFVAFLPAALLTSCASAPQGNRADDLAIAPPASAEQCSALASAAMVHAPVSGLVITASHWQPVGTPVATRAGTDTSLPAHCLVEGYYGEHAGLVGGPYRTGFRMRLPQQWNGRFFFQGGGGSNGVVGDATGYNGPENAPALARGYAVIAQDSGHDNERNSLADHQGNLVFGFDPQARRDYGHASLKPSYDLGRHIVRAFYGRDSRTNIFWGCSKGGQEGMAFAQRYPDAFDGIVAMAPGMSLPRAAIAQAWDTQALAQVLRARGEAPSVAGLKSLISADQYALVAQSALEACDAIDGARDGIIGAVGRCTTQQVEPELRKRQCRAAQSGPCLEPAQIDALVKSMAGPSDSAGQPLYANWAWDSGIGADGWSAWKTGTPQGSPARNILLGGSSLAAVFTTPPTPIRADADSLLAWQLAFDFDRDARKIYASEAPFTTSAWQDVGMRSIDLGAFHQRGGKLIVPHGVSDPVFSVLDTIAWWREVDAANAGAAANFARVFPVPGMNHCNGGPSTDRFDSLAALEDWVVEGRAPEAIAAQAAEGTPFPGREMPLCAYPQLALADGLGGYRCGLLDR